MGTNYYSIARVEHLERKRITLIEETKKLDVSDPALCEDGFRIDGDADRWDRLSPWDRFIEGNSVHLGKRSSGWKFCWNFHDNKYYTNKEELLEFIRSRRVVDEYGKELTPDEFIDMALNCDGIINDMEYMKNHQPWMSNPEDYVDRIIDGLRVSSSTEFS